MALKHLEKATRIREPPTQNHPKGLAGMSHGVFELTEWSIRSLAVLAEEL
jgi:hypothetical protein